MKRILVFLVLMVSVVSMVSCSFAETFIVKTEKDSLNIRSVADSSKIIGGIAKGKTVEIDYYDSYWGYFTYNGEPAKVFMAYLVSSSGATPTKTSNTKKKSTTKDETPAYVPDSEASLIYHVSDKVKSRLNVRAQKKDNAKVIGELWPGDEVYVVKIGKKWTRTVFENQYGFVYSKYLEDWGDNLPDEGELYRVSVNKNTTLNVRAEPKRNAKVLKKISNGTLIKVIEQQDDWAFIYYGLTECGYVKTKYIKEAE